MHRFHECRSVKHSLATTESVHGKILRPRRLQTTKMQHEVRQITVPCHVNTKPASFKSAGAPTAAASSRRRLKLVSSRLSII